MARLQISGINDLKRALTQAGPLALAALAAAAVEEQERVMSVAKERTPVDTGALRTSGTVLPPDVSATRVDVTAGFGGAAADYAIVVHERMGVNHPVGQAKFLESAFLERAKDMGKALARGVEMAWQRLR